PLRYAFGPPSPLVDQLELLLGRPRRLRSVVTRDDLLRQLALRRLGMLAPQRLDLRQRPPREQLVVPPHQPVRNAHQLAVLLLCRLVDADVVAKRFAHLVARDLPVHLSGIDALPQAAGEADLGRRTRRRLPLP